MVKKGAKTKSTILESGLEMASQYGLENVTIGHLAQDTHMSKSGLFAHFQSKENLQIEILQYAGLEFIESVVKPALKAPRGIQRIKKLVEKWILWGSELSGGCIFVNASVEFSDRPGKVRDYLLQQQEAWIEVLRRVGQSAIKAGDFQGETDCDQFAFDMYALLLGYHYYERLLKDSKARKRQEIAMKRLLDSYKVPAPKIVSF